MILGCFHIYIHTFFQSNCYEHKIVEVELGRFPFRRLGNWSATVICPHTWPGNRVISFGVRSCIVSPAVDDCPVWRPRGICKSCIDCIESVDAPDIGENTHRGDI